MDNQPIGQPIGTSVRMLTQVIFGNTMRPGVVRLLREAARNDFKLGNLLNTAIYLETLERQIAANKTKIRAMFENVYANPTESVYEAAVELSDRTDTLTEKFERGLLEFKNVLDGHNLMRDRLHQNKKAQKAPLADGIYILYIALRSGEKVQVAFEAE